MLATLRTYQDKVLAIAGEVERLLRAEGQAAVPRIARLRIDQGMAMAAYQLFVHREIFAPLMRDGEPGASESAKQLKVACIAFSNAFSHYVQEWTRRDPIVEWDSYRAAELAMVAEIRGHVAQVRDSLATSLPLLEPGEGAFARAVRY